MAARTPWKIAIFVLIVGVLRASPAPAQVDEQRARALGIRRLDGRFLTLYTDLPSSPAIDELPEVFEKAVPQWAAFFGKQPPPGWKLRSSLMKDGAKFRLCGLLPPELPKFPNGYSQGDEIWLYEQPTDYYRRHLLLHEGTHAYMVMAAEGTGPPWYFEGIAELLGTHRWADGKLALGVIPQTRDEAPHWSRVKIVRDEIAAGRAMTFPAVMGYSNRAHLENEPYGWCWAAACFLDQHPAYRKAFRDMLQHVNKPAGEFGRIFARKVGGRWPLLTAEWQAYTQSLDYGFDVSREAILARQIHPAPPVGASLKIKAERGWQAVLRVKAGTKYELSAQGRFQVDDQPKPWISEPNGVTLRYYNGQPVGVLLAAVYNAKDPVTQRLSPLCKPQVIGLKGVISCQQDGILFLRINDSPNQLADNAGTVTVVVKPAAK